MTPIDQHQTQDTFRNPRGVVLGLCAGAAMWLCACALLAIVLSACGPSTEIISPARIVCADLDEIVLEFVADSAAIRAGEIITVSVMGHSGPLYSPPGAMKCWAQYAGE